MDAFYASVEQRDSPELKGKPVAVGGRPEGRGVVAAASYEARTFGVHSAMPMVRALKLCPQLNVVKPDFKKYRTISQLVFELFCEVTPLVEPLSLDEAYLDVTTNAWGETLATPVARRLKRQIRKRTGLTASAGVAPNKFLAKVASGWRKPDGLTVVPQQRVETFLHELPVDALWGVGPKTAAKLRRSSIEKLVDVRGIDDAMLRHLVGKQAKCLKRLAYGQDDRPVTPNRTAKSYGSERTYPEDLLDTEVIRSELDQMVKNVAGCLQRKSLYARTVTVKVRYSDFTTVTRSRSDPVPIRNSSTLIDRVVALADKTQIGERPVRLLGVSVRNLSNSDLPADKRGPLLWYLDR